MPASDTPSKPVALVVGAGDFIGAAIARKFARQGYAVAMGRRNGDQLKPLADEIRAEGGEAHAFSLDARQEDQVVGVVDRIERDIGELDAVIFNVGANVNHPLRETMAVLARDPTKVAPKQLLELSIARANTRRLLERGAFEAGASHYPWMVALHSLFLLACPLEVWLLDRPFRLGLGLLMLVLLSLAAALRYWVIASLAGRWTTRVLCLPGEPLVKSGPYRFVRHPNYVAVVVEMFALPLVHGAWLTAIVFSLLNAALLRERIAIEEAAIETAGRPEGGA